MHCLVTAQVICYLQEQGHPFKLGRCDQILHHSESSFFLFFWLCQAACKIPQPWIRPMSPALGVVLITGLPGEVPSQPNIQTFDGMQYEIHL